MKLMTSSAKLLSLAYRICIHAQISVDRDELPYLYLTPLTLQICYLWTEPGLPLSSHQAQRPAVCGALHIYIQMGVKTLI